MRKQIRPLTASSWAGLKKQISEEITRKGYASEDVVVRFYASSRTDTAVETGNDRTQDGRDLNPLEKEAMEKGYLFNQTLWAGDFERLDAETCEGENLLLLSGVSVYDKSKLKTLNEANGIQGTGSAFYLIDGDPRDALVAAFERKTSPISYVAGRAKLLFEKGPGAAYRAVTDHDVRNVKKYFSGRA
jgi:hypothetical protein